MHPTELAEPGYAQSVLVNGRHVVLDRLEEGEDPGDPRTLSLVLDRPDPIGLLTVGSWVQVSLAGGPPSPFRVTSVREYEGNPTPEDRSLVYGVTLEEVQPLGDNGDASSDAIDVLYRTAFMTVVSRTYVRAL